MMKYELALVLSAKIEDEERAAMVEKVQAMITTAVLRSLTSMNGVRNS